MSAFESKADEGLASPRGQLLTQLRHWFIFMQTRRGRACVLGAPRGSWKAAAARCEIGRAIVTS